jgi:hypothetical protein
VHQSARQPRQPLGHRVVHALGDPAAEQDLAEHDVERNRVRMKLLLVDHASSPIIRESGIGE